ncbi:hypothetical protein [Helicobacter sp. 11-8110]|uniref:hypothetical protein n=1 Tax=Helicobacter sp. 11-8110 TaxID=2004997 RepID=UPI000DCD2B44|nr:hypothetical protein [Helicobacter sp. 11-8110]RAX53600.1 hypothetical protein CCY98_01955 [Helicobacter sp. 11-8110]
MEEIEKLKQIGAKEIANKTHIALNKIEKILKMDFEGLRDRVTTIGLIHILEREYQIDLQKWCEEYENFLKENKEEKEKTEANINFKIMHEATQQNDFNNGLIITAVVVILLAIGAYFYFYFNFNFMNNSVESVEQNSTQELDMKESRNEVMDKRIIQENTEVENNATQNLEIAPNLNLDSSASTPLEDTLKTNSNQEILTEENPLEEVAPQVEAKVEIHPLSNVWMGIIYLDTKQRETMIVDKTFKVDLKRPQTIITGHGMLEVKNKDKMDNYNLARRMYFMVNDKGEFVEINSAQYRQYSGGLEW